MQLVSGQVILKTHNLLADSHVVPTRAHWDVRGLRVVQRLPRDSLLETKQSVAKVSHIPARFTRMTRAMPRIVR